MQSHKSAEFVHKSKHAMQVLQERNKSVRVPEQKSINRFDKKHQPSVYIAVTLNLDAASHSLSIKRSFWLDCCYSTRLSYKELPTAPTSHSWALKSARLLPRGGDQALVQTQQDQLAGGVHIRYGKSTARSP